MLIKIGFIVEPICFAEPDVADASSSGRVKGTNVVISRE